MTSEFLERFKHLNAKPIPLEESGICPPAQQLETVWVNVRGREEHEALLKNSDKCKELGLDQVYETIVYLKKWGDWLPKKQ